MIGNYIKAVAVAVSRSTAKLMKTGQTTSYRTGDDGDFEAGRNVSFTVLAENNPFGNTNRFTDELGGQTYTKNIVIDWSTYDGSTVLGYRRTLISADWNNGIDSCIALSVAPFTSGWRMTNVMEAITLANFQLSSVFNYSPLNINDQLFTSTTQASSTTLAYYFLTNGRLLANAKNTSGSIFILPCRTFTVTGTTLS